MLRAARLPARGADAARRRNAQQHRRRTRQGLVSGLTQTGKTTRNPIKGKTASEGAVFPFFRKAHCGLPILAYICPKIIFAKDQARPGKTAHPLLEGACRVVRNAGRRQHQTRSAKRLVGKAPKKRPSCRTQHRQRHSVHAVRIGTALRDRFQRLAAYPAVSTAAAGEGRRLLLAGRGRGGTFHRPSSCAGFKRCSASDECRDSGPQRARSRTAQTQTVQYDRP